MLLVQLKRCISLECMGDNKIAPIDFDISQLHKQHKHQHFVEQFETSQHHKHRKENLPYQQDTKCKMNSQDLTPFLVRNCYIW